MTTLILMRHAKSSWARPGLGDHDRPLNRRGRDAAPAMARWLEARELRPDRVLCSSARRARETADLMCAAAPRLPEPEVSEALYHAGPKALIAHVRRLPIQCETALLICHEPGLSSLLDSLVGRAAAPELSRACDHFPTAAMAVLETVLAGWPEFGTVDVKFVAFAVPRELMAAPGSGGMTT